MPEKGPAGRPPLRLGAVLLAAGGSARMGSAKQLIMLGGRPLVARAAEAALGSSARPVVVVVGAHAGRVQEALARMPVRIVLHPDWQAGLASSIRAGLEGVLDSDPQTEAVLLAPCDQPAFSAAVINRLGELHRETGRIAAARFGERNGAPAVFGRDCFGRLMALSGDKGARDLLNGKSEAVATLDLPELAFDLDFPGDLERWLARHPEA